MFLWYACLSMALLIKRHICSVMMNSPLVHRIILTWRQAMESGFLGVRNCNWEVPLSAYVILTFALVNKQFSAPLKHQSQGKKLVKASLGFRAFYCTSNETKDKPLIPTPLEGVLERGNLHQIVIILSYLDFSLRILYFEMPAYDEIS